MAEEAGLHVDMAGFQAAMEEAKELSRAGAKKGAAAGLKFQAEETAYLQNRCGWGGLLPGCTAGRGRGCRGQKREGEGLLEVAAAGWRYAFGGRQWHVLAFAGSLLVCKGWDHLWAPTHPLLLPGTHPTALSAVLCLRCAVPVLCLRLCAAARPSPTTPTSTAPPTCPPPCWPS